MFELHWPVVVCECQYVFLGLRKKRALLSNAGESVTLSQLLREAKEKAENLPTQDQVGVCQCCWSTVSCGTFL